jgi:hypothetical protein
MEAAKRRQVQGPCGDRYFAMIADHDAPADAPEPVREPRESSIFFEDEVGNYIGCAPLYHRIPLWRVTGQEIGAMLLAALRRG